MYVIVALVVPAVALAAEAIIRSWRPAVILVAAMLLVSLAGNVHEFSQAAHEAGAGPALRRSVMTIPRLPLTAQLPRTLILIPHLVPVKLG